MFIFGRFSDGSRCLSLTKNEAIFKNTHAVLVMLKSRKKVAKNYMQMCTALKFWLLNSTSMTSGVGTNLILLIFDLLDLYMSFMLLGKLLHYSFNDVSLYFVRCRLTKIEAKEYETHPLIFCGLNLKRCCKPSTSVSLDGMLLYIFDYRV